MAMITASVESPPRAPPLPPQVNGVNRSVLKLRTEVSPFIQKLQAAPEGYWFQSSVQLGDVHPRAPNVGWYFVYGTLKDPKLLAEILSLETSTPALYPAKVIGYSIKLWGQYPALVDGRPGEEVRGMAVKVDEQRHAHRLAEYETKAYRSASCLIRFIGEDGSDLEEVEGSTFKYNGDSDDLHDGCFDLDVWLRQMGRTKG
ncbi:hypothetical protein DV735_g4887, partial [Chaetothyriales sp. CBS 134920]